MGEGLEAGRESSSWDEALAVAKVVLERELHCVGFACPGQRRVCGSAAGGGDYRGRRWGGSRGASADALKLVVVVEEELVGLESGGGKGEGEEEEESGEGEKSAARRRHRENGSEIRQIGRCFHPKTNSD